MLGAADLAGHLESVLERIWRQIVDISVRDELVMHARLRLRAGATANCWR